MKPFYDAVKSVDPKLKVLGPGTVSVNPHLQPWLEDFFKVGGAKSIDAFSFHAYNCVNGDQALARTALDSLQALLKKYGADKLEKWQTEQGFFACVYGSYQPRLQGRWTMVEMMVFEQYGIPKEHNHLWYDRSHGFWDFPTWWENDDGSLNPAAPLMRVWSEELYGKHFARAYDLGAVGNRLYVGSLFEGGGRSVAAFQSAGEPEGRVELDVKGGDKLHIVSAFGVESDLPVKDGRAVLTVPELPVYVEPAKNQTIAVVPQDYGPDLALAPGVGRGGRVGGVSDGETRHAEREAHQQRRRQDHQRPVRELVLGAEEGRSAVDEQRQGVPGGGRGPAAETDGGGAGDRLRRPAVAAARVAAAIRIAVRQRRQVGDARQGGRADEDVQGVDAGDAHDRGQLLLDRWIFQHHFKPVTTSKIRLLVHDVTWGGGATKDVADAGGQTGLHQIVLREMEVYGK